MRYVVALAGVAIQVLLVRSAIAEVRASASAPVGDELQLKAAAGDDGGPEQMITLTLTNSAARRITVGGLDFMPESNIEFSTPPGWERAKPPQPPVAVVGRTETNLGAGDSGVWFARLSDYFSRIPPGKASLEITVRVWIDDRREATVLKDSVTVVVVGATTRPTTTPGGG